MYINAARDEKSVTKTNWTVTSINAMNALSFSLDHTETACIPNRLTLIKLEMWANAQRDGRPAEYRWRPLFNAAKFG